MTKLNYGVLGCLMIFSSLYFIKGARVPEVNIKQMLCKNLCLKGMGGNLCTCHAAHFAGKRQVPESQNIPNDDLFEITLNENLQNPYTEYTDISSYMDQYDSDYSKIKDWEVPSFPLSNSEKYNNILLKQFLTHRDDINKQRQINRNWLESWQEYINSKVRQVQREGRLDM
ncbi:unnamed protein product [Owenia fusiformis]|uniref:Uncharacterized protein n=1 Tax=Owenia fusiformis TaxID=6347 RepID=A0A8J1XR03_OWEFU|nr:unnamed protein product [Owenia fusiformis]